MACSTPGCVRPDGHDPPCTNGMMEEIQIGNTAVGEMQVDVLTMNGAACMLRVERGCAVGILKSRIGFERGILEECIQLIMDTRVLEDSEIIGTAGEDTISMMMVVSTDQLLQQLKQADPLSTNIVELCAINRALLGLSNVVEQGNEHAIAALLAILEDTRWFTLAHRRQFRRSEDKIRDQQVLISALRAFARISNKGDERAITALINLMEHGLRGYHDECLDTLSQISSKGEERTITAAIAKLEASSPHVRCAALRALGKVFDKSQKHVITAVAARLADSENSVKKVALQSLVEICGEGDEQTIKAVNAQLEHMISYVGCSALKALARKAYDPEKHVKPIIRVVYANLANSGRLAREGARDVALELLAEIGKSDDSAQPVKDSAAANALAQVCREGNTYTTTAAASVLESMTSSASSSVGGA